MNPVRFLREEWSPWLVGLFAIAVAILAIVLWARARERRGDWGPGLLGAPEAVGYAPADLRAHAVATPVSDPGERWLLGLAAPFVEQAGLLHDRWSLVPSPCDDAWRRRLAAIAAAWEVTRADRWKREVQEAELRIGEPQASSGPADRAPGRSRTSPCCCASASPPATPQRPAPASASPRPPHRCGPTTATGRATPTPSWPPQSTSSPAGRSN